METDLQLGFDKKLFPNFKGDTFDCSICQRVCNIPKQCIGCGRLYCSQCLVNLEKNIGFLACLQCEKQDFQFIKENLKLHYDQLDMMCQCGVLHKIGQKLNHEAQCPAKNMPKCKNYEYCQQNVSINLKEEGVCEVACLLFSNIQQNPQDQNKIHGQICSILNKLKKGELHNGKQIIVQQNIQQSQNFQKQASIYNPNISQQTSNFNNQAIPFTWSQHYKGSNIQLNIISPNVSTCYLKEQGYVFKTVLGTVAFQQGVHYWEIKPEIRTENEMKIGVSLTNTFNMDNAFCDTDKGYAFYGLGSLRNGSNSNGSQYGKKFKNTGTLGVYLNMNKGELWFSLDNQSMGLAYKDPKLTKGPIYPAIALLHHAGATVTTGLNIPHYFSQQ